MSTDRELLVQSATRLLDSEPADLARAMVELGWPMLVFDEADGGLRSNGRDTELLALFETFGRHVRPPQALFQLVLGGTLLSAGLLEPARSKLLASLMDGTRKIACALSEPERPRSRRPLGTCAQREAGGWRLSGTKTLAIGAGDADLVLVSARCSEENGEQNSALFLVDRAMLAHRTRSYTLRDGQTAADLQLDALAVPHASLILEGEAAEQALATAIGRTKACLVAEAAGLIRHLVERTQAYTSQREQFGQPIAQFQVIQHRLADMATMQAQAEAVLAMVMDGTSSSIDENLTALAELALSAAKSAIQLHGGMGMTEELPLGQALRRAMTLLFLL